MDKSLAKVRHDRSRKDFPDLTLEEDEYIEFEFNRAKICLMLIIGGVIGGLIIILIAFLLTLMGQSMLDEMGKNFLFIILLSLLAASIIIGIVSLRIHRGNKLFVTNKHVIQMLMTSLVSSSINIIDLKSIEDVSFHQDTIMQRLFHYGTFRLSTVGEETTYTFKYSDVSAGEINAVTKLITKSKNTEEKEN